jgi:hypothetical protein
MPSTNQPGLLEFAQSVDRLIETATLLELNLPTYLLKMVRLDVTLQAFDIREAELGAFTTLVRGQATLWHNKSAGSADATG